MNDGCNIRELRRKFCRECVALLLVVFCNGELLASDVVRATESYEVAGKSLRIVNSGVASSCHLDDVPVYAVASYDQSAVIVSDRGYVKRKDLERCSSGNPVHVYKIPARVGFLSDINLSKGIYVALDFVDVRPFRYLATVARIGSSRNLVDIDGSYIPGASLSQLRAHAFASSGEAGASIISRDGRYVAPDGLVSCADDASPGVWDIVSNKRIVLDDISCSALFDSENK